MNFLINYYEISYTDKTHLVWNLNYRKPLINTVSNSTDFAYQGQIICDQGSIITGPNFGYHGKKICDRISECKKRSCMYKFIAPMGIEDV